MHDADLILFSTYVHYNNMLQDENVKSIKSSQQ